MKINQLNSKQVIQLLVKEISVGLSEQEVLQLNSWITASPENKALYSRLYSEEYKKQRLQLLNGFNKEKAWESILEEIKPKKKVIFSAYTWQMIGVAASVVLLVGVFYYLNKTEMPNNNTLADNSIKPGTNQATLTLSNGDEIELNNLDSTLQISGVGIDIDAKEVSYIEDEEPSEELIAYHTLKTPRGGAYSITLSDGTRVQLNAASKLTYPKRFSGDERTVYIEGEAYFEVAKDKNKPFYIHSSVNTIRVIGTSFNIRAYPEDTDTRVTLCEGSIELQTQHSIDVLTPNQQAIIDHKKQETTIQQVDSELFTAWKDGKFAFKRETLDHILEDLGRWYNANLFYTNQEIKDFEFSLYMNRQDNIKKVLEIIEATEEVKFSIQDNNIIISPM